ncbi:TetR/AcrR family transcriptional regulator [Marinilongibacter aquaticus]|uniref:TetR/AcrR family transcriptional regulator n=1 Tax=Marinilongibacter aquaticus TaxID=2975157 RepID=UPI0021BD69F0|nr:TetR/AcrR family transcriptional regulator [Marinilongibacter aquaticus]UBM57575.1 TetR/AcrR family transcriptional regulator [Marinilongibacter aquaticus]
MGILERKEREKAELSELILAAALRLFVEKGFEKTSIRNIADQIEYSPATIYLYFKDKNALFLGLQVKAFRQFAKYLSRLDSQLAPKERLYAMGRNYILFALENPELYELMFSLAAPMEALECSDTEWEDGSDSFKMLTAVVSECKALGYFGSAEARDVSLSIWSFMHGLVSLKNKQRLQFLGEPEEQTKARMLRVFEVYYQQLINYEKD